MKKLILLSLFAFNMVIGQEFILTPNNFVNKDDETKNFIVLSYPELNQKQLYDKTKTFIQSKFKNLKGDGLNEVEYSFIKLRASSPGTTVKVFGSESLMSYMVTTYEINFKDGKLMVKPTLERFESNSPGVDNTYINGGNSFAGKSIFKKDGKVWLKNYYEVANVSVNQFIDGLKAYLSNKEDW
ncbi:hypothetical protein SAMN05444360_102175 [Chryseobacterium carnipullorum]|uniref:hypothetical protein n=1 Tax=Chryseobacterium carnipullorum TaxID=1124835 RepID=UPI00091105F9|nr:hypothetical protein [Chryseobacterium carnipullorum]SHL52169.1 hypothetical protein SAMN05444360_102175 [Chryseobacterium carnipullorum]